MKPLTLTAIIILFSSCFSVNKVLKKTGTGYGSLEISTVYLHEGAGIRALEVENNSVYFAGRNGLVGTFDIQKNNLTTTVIDTALEFRALAVNNGNINLVNIQSPVYLFSGSSVNNLKNRLLDEHPEAFYNALDIHESGFGAVLGDQTEGCLTIKITLDYGKTWKRVDCENLEPFVVGEAAFAASDTNIKITDKNTLLIATGGAVSRILKTQSRGKSWKKFITTPVIQGSMSTGIYSMDFYNKKTGIAIGGDYTQPENKVQNLIQTYDGGLTWEINDHPSRPPYSSCIQYFPGYKGEKIIAVGPSGVFISQNQGKTWRQLSHLNLNTIRFIDHNSAVAGGPDGLFSLEFKD